MRPVPPHRIFVGWDASQVRAWNVAHWSIRRTTAQVPVDIRRIALAELQGTGLYTRPTETREHGYFDVISQAAMATGHACARFLVPALCHYEGWAVFMDGDVLVREDLAALFALADPEKALQVVQHRHVPSGTVKMEGQAQAAYRRKNWSSVILWHVGHPANRALTVKVANTVPGRDLHRFCWLEDDLIGALPARWNVLIGEETVPDPAIAHFTLGVPDLPGYERQPYAAEWRETARACGYRLPDPAPAEEVA